LLTVLFRVMNQFEAAEEGNLQQLRVALTVNNVNDVDHVSGWTALHFFVDASDGPVDCVKFCIEMGANVNARTNHGWTPLHFASYQGHPDVIRVLLDAGAIVDATDNIGCTPLFCAFRYKNGAAAQLLIDRVAKVSNVKLDDSVPTIPDWVNAFMESRSNCRIAAIIIIGIHKYRRTAVTGNNDVNVIKLISKHIWSTRMEWVAPPYNFFNSRNSINEEESFSLNEETRNCE
jgi:ankyrin repeat protein